MAVVACAITAWGAPAGEYIGYLYPAGGQQGTTVRITIGGQRLRGVRDVSCSGKGVHATVVGYVGANGPLNQLQQEELKRRIQELIELRRPLAAPPKPAPTPPAPAATTPTTTMTGATPIVVQTPPPVTLPDLPELRNLDQMTVKQLRKVFDKFLNRQKRTKPPLAEEVTLDITIDADAAPGDRELRLRTPLGLTNPMIFQVGKALELREKDREDDDAIGPPPAEAPVVLNGQIMPGEVDRFPLKLRSGQRLAITAHARRLIPYLADAVPGWFQAIVALYDAKGKELAYADDNGFDPDPTLYYQAPQDGDYVLAIRDALYRGREDFVYRVAIDTQAPGPALAPFKSLGKVGAAWADADPLLPYVDDQLPQRDEVEPNDAARTAMRVSVPLLLKGRIAQPGDTDVFQFTGKAGDLVVAEVYARRLGSPMDSLLRVRDASGHILAANDDHDNGEVGLLTHHADSYLSTKLPADGIFYVEVSDVQRHGGDDFNYYLRIAPPQPDFALRMTPSSVGVPAGSAAPITVYAFRKDGWDGDIEVTLKDAPTGFTLGAARIPKGKESARITLTAPRLLFEQPVALQLEGRAVIDGKTITRPVVPAERMMQAFAYYHLVPAQQFLVWVMRGGRNAPAQ
jgi:hypothetical protein